MTLTIPQPIHLINGKEDDSPNLWVLHDGLSALKEFIAIQSDEVIRRFQFAIPKRRKPEVLLLADSLSRSAMPPQLVLPNSTAYKSHRGISTLFLPVAKRFKLTIRADVLRKKFHTDEGEIVWLKETTKGFVPCRLSQSALRPLLEAIEYTSEKHAPTRQAWQQSSDFAFEGFVEIQEKQEPPKPTEQPKEQPKQKPVERRTPSVFDAPKPVEVVRKTKTTDIDRGDPTKPLRDQLAELEREFISMEGPLDTPERLALWPRIAELNSKLDKPHEAGIAWANYLWEQEEFKNTDVSKWLLSGTKGEDEKPINYSMSTFAARIIRECGESPVSLVFQKGLAFDCDYLLRNEHLLGIRPAWMAWHAIHTLNNDVLGMARTRDRLLNRLLEQGGLSKERDIPAFMRNAGDKANRTREAVDGMREVYNLAQAWGIEHDVNRPYMNLVFAFGFASLGEQTETKRLQTEAHSILKYGEPVHAILTTAFDYRIDRALDGAKHHAEMSDQIKTRIADLAKDTGDKSHTASYTVNSMFANSWILEPTARTNQYSQWLKLNDPILQELAELAKIQDDLELALQISNVLSKPLKPDQYLTALAGIMPISARLGENHVVRLLQFVPKTLSDTLDIKDTVVHEKQRKLLEQSLILAAHFGRGDLVSTLFEQFTGMLANRTGKELTDDINEVSREALRSLRKLGMTDQIHRFLNQVEKQVTRGLNFEALKQQAGISWPDTLRNLLALAEGWYTVGNHEKAGLFVKEAREAILSGNIRNDQDQVKLVRVYISAMAQAPSSEALAAIKELFLKMRKLPNTFTSSVHFSRVHLAIVEDAVRLFLGESFTTNDKARKLAEDDEYLVRRRIHRDMKRMMDKG